MTSILKQPLNGPSGPRGLARLPALGTSALLAALLLAGCGGGGSSDGVTALKVDGAVDRPASYTLGDLALVPPVAQAVSFSSGSAAPVPHVYAGPPLWTVLNGSGVQVDATKKNDILNRYLLATGADGYKVVFALGELSPDFGNKPSIVADGEVVANVPGPLNATDGPLRVTAPGDVKGGRYVSMLNHLTVRNSASTAAGTAAGGTSASFAVSGAVLRPQRFDLAALQALPAVTQTIAGTSYTGVSLFTLLNSTTGLSVDATAKNPSLAMYAVATGSDGYKAMVSLGEIDPGFGNRGALIAYQTAGAGLGANGVARLVVDGDVKQGRSVSNLIAIEVFAAAAAPAP
jgi:DMSO/TMAO reductase YedYZ molybdopterin-dependent catalytic subunit